MTADTISETRTYREDYGRSHRYWIDGIRVQGCTTILGKAVPKNLAKWGAEQTAAKAINNWSKLGRMPIAQRLRELEKAPWEDIDRAGIKGTRVHTLAEKLVNGETVTVPADIAGHVTACRSFLTEWSVKPLHVELPVFSRRHMYGATIDLIARLADGQVWSLDWKSSRSGVWPDVSWQLAAGRYADFYIGDDGTETPLPEINACGAVWVRADGEYEFYPMEVSRTVFRQFLSLKSVAEALDDSQGYKGDPLQPPVVLT